MKRSPLIILLAALVLPFFASTDATAREKEKLTYRSSKSTSRVASKFFAQPRRQLRPVKRVFLNTNVYRHQGLATVRHEEVSSPEIIFHIRNGRLVPGHAYDR